MVQHPHKALLGLNLFSQHLVINHDNKHIANLLVSTYNSQVTGNHPTFIMLSKAKHWLQAYTT